jgi:hypothetical protein
LVKFAEKQLGADGFGPVPEAVVLWQIAQATSRFPEVLWLIVTPLIVRGPCQSVGCAFAAVWQVEHAVDAIPPLKLIVPAAPWHPWHQVRSALAPTPWKPVPALNHAAPVVCGAAAALWHIVPLKQPGAVPAGAGDVGIAGLFGFAVPV